MRTRRFGNTELEVSEIGFGAWAIGGPAMAGDIPIGWGEVEDETSIKALQRAFELGINFYDTADFYGLGHSEELLGKVFGNSSDVIIASKVGHRLAEDQSIYVDYRKEYILAACEASLKRLKRECIDFYQLHTAKVQHFEEEECAEAMQQLQQEGKIRYWGLSLNTFAPEPEATFLMEKQLGMGFQLVFNLLNQKALELMEKAHASGYGIIARMPLQFGLLTGKFTPATRFPSDDHRRFRLPPSILEQALEALAPAWSLGEKYHLTPTELALSFILSFPSVSTVIPGIKTPEQAEMNVQNLKILSPEERDHLVSMYLTRFAPVVDLMRKQG